MSPIIIGIVGLGVLFFLLGTGVPIGLAMTLVGIVGYATLVGFEAAFFQAASVSFSAISDYNFIIIPLFIFMAQIIFNAGFGERLYRLANTWIGSIPGGLAASTIVSCAIFAAVSASSIATTITMGLVALPEMKKYGYDESFSCATIVAGGTLGVLIPPSGILILYGIMTEQSIGKLFIAGIVPGIILSFLFIIQILIQARLRPASAPAGPKFSFIERLKALGLSVEIILLIFIVLIGMMVGWFSPTHAGAVGSFGALTFALLRRRLTWAQLTSAMRDTMYTSGMIFMILIGGLVLNLFLTMSTIPMALASSIAQSPFPPVIVLILMLSIYVVLGCFVDTYSMILLTIPLFFPIVQTLNFDPIVFGILTVLVAEMGLITPPVGINVFTICGISKEVPMQDVFKSSLLFVFTISVFVAILIMYPNIALFLPKYFGMP
jgi:tripartite ATP-independent transporter DctM subunit